MCTVKEWGLNSIRCHSYCPPEAAFQAADEEGVLLLVECGMWNIFREGIPMLEVLRQEAYPETVRASPFLCFFLPVQRAGREMVSAFEGMGDGDKGI